MSKSLRVWAQCELRPSPGAEPWIHVRHRGGDFFIPGIAAASELMQGVKEGWTRRPHVGKWADGTITLGLDEYLRLVAVDSKSALDDANELCRVLNIPITGGGKTEG